MNSAPVTPEGSSSGEVEPARVLLVDDDPMVRTGISLILSSAVDITVVGSIDDGSQAIPAIMECRPSVILLDIRMKTLDGIATTRLIRQLPQPPAILMLTAFDVDRYVIESIEAGASGFLLKDEEPQEIIAAVRKIARGEPALSARSSARLMHHVASSNQMTLRHDAQRRLSLLSPREREFAIAIAQGHTNSEMASMLYCALSTVKAVNRTIMLKLELTNRVQIAVLAFQAGMLE